MDTRKTITTADGRMSVIQAISDPLEWLVFRSSSPDEILALINPKYFSITRSKGPGIMVYTDPEDPDPFFCVDDIRNFHELIDECSAQLTKQ